MNEMKIVNQALTHLTEHTGLTGEWLPLKNETDGVLHLLLKNKKIRFTAEVKRELREYHLPKILEMKHNNDDLIVVAERIFPMLKAKLREYEIAYLDGAGNIFINTEDNFIWLDGQKPIEVEKPITNRAFTKTGLKTVFYLLLHEDAINLPYRTLAINTNVALGNIKNIITGLKEAGYILQINDKEMQLLNKKALLDRWITGYKETLKPTIHLGNFRFYNNSHFVDWKNLPIRPSETLWGGEPAAEIITNYLNPEILTIYTTENKAELIPQWKLIPDPNGNIRFYQKFWIDHEFDKLPYTPYLLTYADLILTNDPRCIETAEMIYNQYLKDEFEQY